MILKISVVASVALALACWGIASRPDTFHLERSIATAAPARNAFAEVNDFHKWAAWSPYEKLDPQMKRTFEGPASGTGASYAWAGTGKAGEGRMTIEKSDDPALIAIRLEFIRPMAATNRATFTFVPTKEGTRVTWAMDGNNGFLAKAFHLVIDMDKLIGGDFEQGLAALKALAEGAPKTTETAKIAE